MRVYGSVPGWIALTGGVGCGGVGTGGIIRGSSYPVWVPIPG
jgi:hypothetical protein